MGHDPDVPRGYAELSSTGDVARQRRCGVGWRLICEGDLHPELGAPILSTCDLSDSDDRVEMHAHL